MTAAPKKSFFEASPNIGIDSVAISLATVTFTYPQVVNVSRGVLPAVTNAATLSVVARAMPFQIPVKFAQFSLMREVKFKLDEKSPATKGINTMVAYGSTGVPFQSVLYNQCISDIYKYHNKSAPSLGGTGVLGTAKQLFWKKVYPGIFWCFLRECCATGGALVLGPAIAPHFAPYIGEDRPVLVRFTSGLVAGWCTAFFTQWMHNTALTAGSMSELGEKATTTASFRRAVTTLGVSLIYKNYLQRMMVIAIASSTLNTFPVFQ
ncbi:hypothetical protein DIPPA_16733 [Diplonema papillatum]|nr:hypothetical protein DIPPA_16733 [Diplonema papillatum]